MIKMMQSVLARRSDSRRSRLDCPASFPAPPGPAATCNRNHPCNHEHLSEHPPLPHRQLQRAVCEPFPKGTSHNETFPKIWQTFGAPDTAPVVCQLIEGLIKTRAERTPTNSTLLIASLCANEIVHMVEETAMASWTACRHLRSYCRVDGVIGPGGPRDNLTISQSSQVSKRKRHLAPPPPHTERESAQELRAESHPQTFWMKML